MEFLTFGKQLEKSGIPRSFYKGTIQDSLDISLNLIAEVCQSYPIHAKDPPLLSHHIVNQVVTYI